MMKLTLFQLNYHENSHISSLFYSEYPFSHHGLPSTDGLSEENEQDIESRDGLPNATSPGSIPSIPDSEPFVQPIAISDSQPDIQPTTTRTGGIRKQKNAPYSSVKGYKRDKASIGYRLIKSKGRSCKRIRLCTSCLKKIQVGRCTILRIGKMYGSIYLFYFSLD